MLIAVWEINLLCHLSLFSAHYRSMSYAVMSSWMPVRLTITINLNHLTFWPHGPWMPGTRSLAMSVMTAAADARTDTQTDRQTRWRCWKPHTILVSIIGRRRKMLARGLSTVPTLPRRPRRRHGCSGLHALWYDTIRYDTIRDAILTCARKPTWVSLIYRTKPTTKKCKNRKTKSRKQICSEISSENPCSEYLRRRNERLQWEGFAVKEGFKPGAKEWVGGHQIITVSMTVGRRLLTVGIGAGVRYYAIRLLLWTCVICFAGFVQYTMRNCTERVFLQFMMVFGMVPSSHKLTAALRLSIYTFELIRFLHFSFSVWWTRSVATHLQTLSENSLLCPAFY